MELQQSCKLNDVVIKTVVESVIPYLKSENDIIEIGDIFKSFILPPRDNGHAVQDFKLKLHWSVLQIVWNLINGEFVDILLL